MSSAPMQMDDETSALETDPIWMSSRTARQIFALGQVEKVDITRLLALAASSISLLTLPQTDAPEDSLPQGDERSEQFVLEVSEYFERLDAIQIAIRSSLAHIRNSRIAPSAINAPPPNFVPPSLGVGMPSDDNESTAPRKNRGLQEERIERDAWKGILDALRRLKAEQQAQNETQATTSSSDDHSMDMDMETQMQ
ncbi:Mediator of RNA polymerase II transcription subunit 11 [Mycena sanguinolenta]|uniref:Mediator of RNA polymerase II transcription subunit 11 n=1 Tax=Mycena sanguinolenta TaxID=230812 RepID=A0A8H7CIL1_9AGAR|nr:Mediator of RNA polymerase II transcription subunit 11 [Mycena sanguinolenta]